MAELWPRRALATTLKFADVNLRPRYDVATHERPQFMGLVSWLRTIIVAAVMCDVVIDDERYSGPRQLLVMTLR